MRKRRARARSRKLHGRASMPRTIVRRPSAEQAARDKSATTRAGADPVTRWVRAAALAVTLAVAVDVVVIIAARIGYPYEVEWMSGAILDHVERVRNGAPLYGPPSAAFTPFIYTPGYYWVCAWVSRALPEQMACR